MEGDASTRFLARTSDSGACYGCLVQETTGPLLESVPNVSEGRDPLRIEVYRRTLLDAGAAVLHVHSDPDHHRSVFTVAGDPEVLHRGLVALAERAIADIDLRQHQGVHPRVGALDVVPFVPLGTTSWEVAIAAARRLGEELARRFDLPVWLYERSATAPQRRALPDLRRGGFEGLGAKLLLPDYRPDFGPRRPHLTAGATIVGARSLLVAWNVLIAPRATNLSSQDCARAAQAVARVVRAASGGLPAVRAIGVWLAHRDLAQVSLNLLDTDRTPMTVVFDRVEEEAAERGFRVVETELIGLAAQAALPSDPGRRLKLRPAGNPVLEDALSRAGLVP